MMKTFLILLFCANCLFSIKLEQRPADNSINMRNPSLTTLKNATLGEFIVGQNNKTLYILDSEHVGSGFTAADFKIKCLSNCLKTWIPLIIKDNTELMITGNKLQKNLLGKIKRENGKMQATYNGFPLYYFISDRKAGDTLGQNKKTEWGLWYVLGVDGKPIKK
jgi:predicted lipoprotein with Yx(FWY)xxD motif